MPPPLIAVVEPDPGLRTVLCQLLEEEGYQTVAWGRADAVPAGLELAALALLVLDLARDDAAGNMELLARLEQADPPRCIPVIVLSADYLALRRRQAALEAKGYPVLEMPVAYDAFLHLVATALGTDEGEAV